MQRPDRGFVYALAYTVGLLLLVAAAIGPELGGLGIALLVAGGGSFAFFVVSTDFEEVATICHRTIVFSQGEIAGELCGARLTTDNLIQTASAGKYAAE